MTEQAETREGQMVVVERDDSGKPTIWCDPEVAPLVAALNGAGFRTVASCSGHGKRPAIIALADGREIIIAKDFDEARKIDGLFPGINGEPATIAAPAPVERVEQEAVATVEVMPDQSQVWVALKTQWLPVGLHKLYTAPQPAPTAAPSRDVIRATLMANGFTIKEGHTDLKPYVYEAVEALFAKAAPTAVQDVAGRTDSERLDFILQKARKVTAEHDLTVDGWEISVYVEEGAMGDVRYPEIPFTGKWVTGSPEVLAVQRQAIDAAMPAHQSGGAK